MTDYLDPRTGGTWPIETPRWCAPDGTPLLLNPLPGIGRDGIDTATRGLWRYRAALPFVPDAPITLGEGGTPLLARTVAGAPALVKCEWFAPTGSFKDRGASVMLSLLRAQGITAVLEDSSGNGGAAIAAYAAAGGMAATIMAPAATSPAKTAQARAYGARLVLVPGDRQATSDAALVAARDPAPGAPFYASHAWHPFFLQGTKTLAYELWEDLGFRAPDNVIVPCGAGSNVLGCEIGFAELLRAGAIDTLPRIFAAQPAVCAPIAAALLGADEAETGGAFDEAPPDRWPLGPTIAEGTAIARPVRLREVVGALLSTGGGAVMLDEAEIAQATRDLALQGLYVEPTCAQVAAAYARLLESGAIQAGQTTVLVLTGSGLKATPVIERLLAEA